MKQTSESPKLDFDSSLLLQLEKLKVETSYHSKNGANPKSHI